MSRRRARGTGRHQAHEEGELDAALGFALEELLHHSDRCLRCAAILDVLPDLAAPGEPDPLFSVDAEQLCPVGARLLEPTLILLRTRARLDDRQRSGPAPPRRPTRGRG